MCQKDNRPTIVFKKVRFLKPVAYNLGPSSRLIVHLSSPHLILLYCHELQFMTKISKDLSKQYLIHKFNNILRYLDDI